MLNKKKALVELIVLLILLFGCYVAVMSMYNYVSDDNMFNAEYEKNQRWFKAKGMIK